MRWFDPLRLSAEKALDRELLTAYEDDLELILLHGGGQSARELAAWPGEVRGFGPVKAAAAEVARQLRQAARAALPTSPAASG